MDKFKDFIKDDKAEAQDIVVNVSIALILAATLGVAAWQLLGNANYTGVDATTKTLVQTVVGVVGAIAIVLGILKFVRQ